MAQTFFPVSVTEITPSTASAWVDVDVSSYVPEGATGVILHLVNIHSTSSYAIGLRKNGSTDHRVTYIEVGVHCWAAIGVDSNRVFEAYVGNTTYIDIYLVGYTKAGVTFFTNAPDKSLDTTGAWTDINCSSQAPNAVGLIFEVVSDISSTAYTGFRKNGSSDNRGTIIRAHNTFSAIIGCDSSQICEGFIGSTYTDFFLTGYITDGAVFNLNATNVSLGTTGSWLDLSALPSGANMGFIEVNGISGYRYRYGLRKNGSSENIYRYALSHPWAFIECDDDGIIEGIVEVSIGFFVVGYAYTPSVTTPTVTTSACTNVTTTSAQANGEIIDTGGENCTTRGFCYKQGTTGDPTTADSKAYDTGSFGTGTYSKSITNLSPGTGYRVRAYAINSAGTGYGTTVQLKTSYDETGKLQTILATAGETESATFNELREQNILSVLSKADTANFVEVRGQDILAVLDQTGQAIFNEQSGQNILVSLEGNAYQSFQEFVGQQILSILSRAEQLTQVETTGQTIQAIQSSSDTQAMNEHRGQTTLIILNGNAYQSFDEKREQVIWSVLSSIDQLTKTETREQVILTVLDQIDQASFNEHKGQNLLTIITGNVYQSYTETAGQVILSILEKSEQLTQVETRGQIVLTEIGHGEQLTQVEKREQVILGTAGETNFQSMLETRLQAVLTVIEATAGAYYKEAGEQVILTVQAVNDALTFTEAREQTILTVITEFDEIFRLLTALKYVLELHDGAGNLISILENAHDINFSQSINSPSTLSFSLPADDEKGSGLTLANEIWLRNLRTGAVLKRFRLSQKRDSR